RVRCCRYGDSASGRPNCCSQLRHRTAGKGDAVGGFGRCNEYGQVLRRSAPRGARSRTGERTIGANHPPSPGINASVRNRKRRDAITVYRCTTDQRSAGPVDRIGTANRPVAASIKHCNGSIEFHCERSAYKCLAVQVEWRLTGKPSLLSACFLSYSRLVGTVTHCLPAAS